jgi:hypothetical protein
LTLWPRPRHGCEAAAHRDVTVDATVAGRAKFLFGGDVTARMENPVKEAEKAGAD